MMQYFDSYAIEGKFSMAFQPGRSAKTGFRAGTQAHVIDQGLRTYMLRVYNYMASALFLSAIVAYLIASSPAALNLIYGTPLKWVVMFAPLGLVFFLIKRLNKMSLAAAQATFWIYAALVGASLAFIFVVYTSTSIVRVFLITGVTFGAMSLYGYSTKKDLSSWGSFLFMGLIGILIASIVNLFLGSDMLHWVISVVGVLVFVGLTAYDTQQIKSTYNAGDSQAVKGKKAIFGALRLYLDFINLFMMLLHLFGRRG